MAILGVVALLAACNPGALEAEPFEGIWESDGWGTYLVIGGDVEFFEHTASHCLSVGSVGARGIAEAISFDGDRLLLRDSDREIRFDRIDVLPIACADADPSSDPVLAVETMAATVEEHIVGDLDSGWVDRRADAVRRAAAGEDLRSVLVDLVAPLGGRVRFASDDGVWPEAIAIDHPGAIAQDTAAYAVGVVDGVGYLGVTRTGPFAADEGESGRITSRLVDEAVSGDAVILDLRAASAGALVDGLLILTRFVPEASRVATLMARADDGLVPAGDLWVTPVATGVFTGPVYVLIGPDTRGVAELLAHVLGRLDTVTVLGRSTAGDPGPALIRYLPNGWSMSVPNLVVEGADGGVLGPVEPDVPTDDPLREALGLAG